MKFIQKWHDSESYQTDFGMILDVILYEVHTCDFPELILTMLLTVSAAAWKDN